MARTPVARGKILDLLCKQKKHLSVGAVLALLKKQKDSTGIATVYRTLNSLVAEGLAVKHVFENEEAFFEIASARHHDHLICEKCGAVEEFTSPTIEKLQEQIARKHGFKLKTHRLELFGFCKKCQ